ncbi:Mannose-1-phosphate guanylyltransferase RfbM [compost metagenome]
MGLPTDYEQLLQQYTQLPSISFDYAVIEKEKHVLVIPYAGDWKDLGTWNTLTEEMSTHILGKGLLSEDSTHTHLMNELNMPIVVLGLPGIVVAASHDGILVADKKASPRLKELLQEQVNNDHMEICRWGSSRKMDHIWMEDGTEVATRRILVLSGESYQLNRNQMSRGVWCIVKGKGKVLLHHTTALTSSGDIWELNAEGHCEIIAETTVEFIETRFGCLPAQEG